MSPPPGLQRGKSPFNAKEGTTAGGHLTPEQRAKRAPKRNADQIARDRDFVTRLRFNEGLTQWEITDRVNAMLKANSANYTLSRSQVRTDIVQIVRAYERSTRGTLEHYRATELMKLEWREGELMRAWERSKQPERVQTNRGLIPTATLKKDASAKVPVTEVRDTQRGQVGDVSFINALNEITRLRWKILGFDVSKNEHSGPDGKPIETIERVSFTEFVHRMHTDDKAKGRPSRVLAMPADLLSRSGRTEGDASGQRASN